MTTNPELGVDQRGSVLWLTIRREERRNALSPDILAGLATALEQAGADRMALAAADQPAGTLCVGGF